MKKVANLEKKLDAVTKKLTGELPNEYGILRWRLRCTPQELAAALDKAGADGWRPTMEHDDGTDIIAELKAHQSILTDMAAVNRHSRCPCGCGGSWNRTVGGTVGLKPTVWMGCSRNRGSSVGGSITGAGQVAQINAVTASSERLGITADDMVALHQRLANAKSWETSEVEADIRAEVN